MIEMEERKCVVVFVKSPQAGAVKTRLAGEIGDEAACELYKSFAEDVLCALGRTSARVRLFYDPPGGRERIESWLGDCYELVPQEGADLGERMAEAFGDCFAQGFSTVVLIGSDIPDMTVEYVEKAFDVLRSDDAVIGPASDGGYYLIGFRRDGFSPDVFRDITWGSQSVLDETTKKMNAGGVSFSRLGVLHDIDNVSDLHSFFERNQNSGAGSLKTIQTLKKTFYWSVADER